MKVFNTLYISKEQTSSWIKNKELDKENRCIIQIHSSSLQAEACVELAKYIKKLLPYATVCGCAVTGIIHDGEIYEHETLITLWEFEYGNVFSKIQSTLNLSPKDIAESIANDARNLTTNFGTLVFDFSHDDIHEIVKHINEALPKVSFIGGIAGTMKKGEITSFLFDENDYYTNAYLVNFISNDYVLDYTDIILGHPPISDVYSITKSHDEYIDEIEGESALDWIKDKLGLNKLSEKYDLTNLDIRDILLRFPLVLEDYNSSTRFTYFEEESNKLRLYASKLESGQRFRIGYLSPLKSAEELQEVCQNLQMISAETIFSYSCAFRKLFSNNISKWEIDAFKNSHINGVFMNGEIGTKNGQVQLLHGSTCVFTLAEKVAIIEPNLSVFNSISTLVEANDDLITKIRLTGENLQSSIFYSFVNYEEQVKNRFSHVNEEYSIPQFLKNQVKSTKRQICLVSVEDFNKHMQNLGEHEFKNLSDRNRKNISSFLKEKYPSYNFNFYTYDVEHFFFTMEEKVKDTIFIEIVRSLYANCGSSIFEEKEIYYNNFTFTLTGLSITQLLDFVKMKDIPLEHKRFNQCDKASSQINSLHEVFQMVAILKEIINNKSIIPYFQGIYDNSRGFFYMYEAFMRLQQPDGKILFPTDFMEIAKKYDLYLTLSSLMMAKIFELFQDRNEVVTINIPTQDILSDKFRATIYEHIENLSNPQNFVFELLDVENFADLEILRSFIQHVKFYGCKIAIDDLGAGYANFIELDHIEIDYIKINSSLTKLLGTDYNYNNVLNAITEMSEKMNVKIIAKFVETASTQKLLIQNGVHFSQGYFFSKPMPFSELKIISKEDIEQHSCPEKNKEKYIPLPYQKNAKKDNFYLYLGGLLVALLSIFSVTLYVNYNKNEFKKINEEFLMDMATGLSDKISLFVEESKISLRLMSIAMSDNTDAGENFYQQELLDMISATKFDDAFVSYGGRPAVDGYGFELNVPIEKIYGKTKETEVLKHPILTNNNGNKTLLFSSNLFLKGQKIGEIYGAYKVDDIVNLLALKTLGGEAFYHICQVDGSPVYLSTRQENTYTSGNMYDILDTFDITNGHTPESIRKDMQDGNIVLLNYRVLNEERSAVMVRIPGTSWCIVSVVVAEINSRMLKANNQSTLVFITFITAIYILYFWLITEIFRRHRGVILKTLEASQSLSNSLQLSIEKDSLTGTFSRATAIEKISNIISTKTKKGVVHALAILDIDNFKYINDTYGHHTGDIYLQTFVSAVKLGIKPGNVLGRLGGDEFLLLLDNVKDKEEVVAIFDKIFDHIHQIYLGNVDLHCVSVSAGIIMITENDKTYEELMLKADNTLYEAKRKGKNKYLFTDG